MASSEQQGEARTIPAAEIVGNAFVDQYYHMLHESPEHVHRFYQDGSKLGRLGENGLMDVATTMQEINEKILSLGYSEFSSEIVSMDAQESFGGGVLILVTGFMTGKDAVRRKFTQSFFLAPQDKGYFVLNDVFRYADENENRGPMDDVESPVNPDQDPFVVPVVPETAITKADDFDGEEVYNPDNGQASIEEEEPPVPEVVDEVPDDSQMVDGSTSKIEEVPKKSYASIVKVMKETPASSSTLTAAPVRSAPKIQEQQVTAAPAPPSVSEATDSNASAGSGNNQETEAEGYSIYLKGLPSNATPFLLENEFKRFGTIKSGGIQVRTQRGFCFGFVEFEEASAAQSAIEASPVMVNGRSVVVEEKKSTNRGNSRGRFPSGRGQGFRNEGARARGNYGNGRSYDRGDNNGRGEFGYRNGNRGGAFSNRGRDGYQRNDQMGGNGGRVNRTGGLAVNLTAKTASVRVPATA